MNGSYKGEDAISKLMYDFGCKESKDFYYQELARGLKHFKEEEGGRKIMCEAVEKYADRKVENARLDNLPDSIKKIMKNLKIEVDQAMNVLEASDRMALRKRL